MSLDIDLGMYLDTGDKDLYYVELYSANITHNLGKMAGLVGLYDCLWHPDKNTTANDLIKPLVTGLHKLKTSPEYYKDYEPDNGWGTYESLIDFLEKLLKNCIKHNKALISVSI